MFDDEDDRLGPHPYRMLGHLRRRCFECGGTCEDSVIELARDTQMSDYQARHALDYLVRLRYLSRAERSGASSILAVVKDPQPLSKSQGSQPQSSAPTPSEFEGVPLKNPQGTPAKNEGDPSKNGRAPLRISQGTPAKNEGVSNKEVRREEGKKEETPPPSSSAHPHGRLNGHGTGHGGGGVSLNQGGRQGDPEKLAFCLSRKVWRELAESAAAGPVTLPELRHAWGEVVNGTRDEAQRPARFAGRIKSILRGRGAHT